jgi:hypothetical protein
MNHSLSARGAQAGEKARDLGHFAGRGVWHRPAESAKDQNAARLRRGDGRSGFAQPTGILRPREGRGIFAALRAGENDSGFRVKPGMTTHFFDGGPFFASPGVHPQPAANTRANGYLPL